MKPSTLNFTALVAALLATSAPFTLADEATTDPVGFFTNTLAASGGSTRVNRSMSIPLYRASVYAAAVTSVTNGSPNSTCQVNGFNATTTNVVTNPHLLRVKSATDTSHVGRFFLITAASGDQLTVSNASLSSSLSVGDSCEILPANTMASVFGAPPPAGWLNGTSVTGADNVYIWNGSTWLTYFYHSTNNRWQRSGALGSQNNAIVYPDEGVFISRLGTTPVDLVSTGTVPTTAEKSDIDPTASTFVSNRFPVDTQLIDVGLHLTAGWVANTSANSADRVFLWNATTSTWDTYFYHSTNNRWQRSGALGSQNTTVIPAGSAMFITRIGGASVSTLSQVLPYTP